LRYDPESGRMKRVSGNVLMDLFNNTLPRAQLATAALGINSRYNDVASRDPDAAQRMLISMAGVPQLWRQKSPYQEMFKSEISRQTSQNDVKNDALKSGDWSEALQYPELRELFAAIQQLPPETLAQVAGGSPDQVAEFVQQQASAG